MQYVLFLNRFEKDINVLKKKLANLGISLLSFNKNYAVIEGKDIEKALSMQEVAGISKIIIDWKLFKTFDFDKLKKDALLTIQDSSKKEYKIKTKFYDKTSFSSKRIYKTINPLLKKKGFIINENNPEVILHVEFKKEEGKTYYRLSYSYSESKNMVNVDYSRFAVVLENPTLVEEVSDFLRICWIFKIPLYIITKNKDFNKLLEKAKKITKGIEYDKMKLIISEKIPKEYSLVGFSKLAKENEKGLKHYLSSNDKIALVFGDDKFGLTQETRDKMDIMFRLTPEIKKPLRASHALSYVLGLYTSLKVL